VTVTYFVRFAASFEQLATMVATKCKEKINFPARLRKNCDKGIEVIF
jgi:hypothetical protein